MRVSCSTHTSFCAVQPKFIPEFIRRQAEADYDVVSGTRYVTGAARRTIGRRKQWSGGQHASGGEHTGANTAVESDAA